MKTTGIGRSAEVAVAEYLERTGYEVLQKNWRTRWCEIDIIAQKSKAVYFIEVKYRASESHGSGFEYIGPNKLRQLEFAARFWCQYSNWNGDYRLLGAQVSGINFENIQIVEL